MCINCLNYLKFRSGLYTYMLTLLYIQGCHTRKKIFKKTKYGNDFQVMNGSC